MKLLIFILVIAFAVILKPTLAGYPVCPRGQVYNACLGACPPACRDNERACAAVCIPGCICAFNWVFDDTGRCIPRNFCCPKGRVESACDARCQPTCEDPQGTRPCAQQCVRGCVCAPRTVLHRSGRCVPPSFC